MFKKEYFLVFIVIGLGIVYGVLSLLVYITRGKWFKALNSRFRIGAMIVTFTAMLTSGGIAFSQAETPTPTPTPVYGTLVPSDEPTPTPFHPPPTVVPYGVTTPTTPENSEAETPTLS